MARGSSKKGATMKPEVVPQVRNSLEWLPHGWILQIKTQSSVKRVGRKYKCYFDPVSGSQFYSKAGVVRFLNSENFCTTSREKRCFKASTTDNVLAQFEYSPHGLPHGWIKKLNFRKSNRKGIKADPYYTDPLSGYVFRSLKDAIHYVETGEIRKRVMKRSVHEMYSIEKEIPQPIPIKKLKSLRSSTKRILFTDGEPTLNGEVTVEIDASPDKLLLPPPDHASSESFQKANENKRKVLEAANGEQKKRARIKMSKSTIKLEEKGVEMDKFSNKLKLPAPGHASSISFQNVDLTSSPSIERTEGKADKKRKKGRKAPSGNSLDTGNYKEQKAKRESLPKTIFQSEKEKKTSEEMREPCTVIVTTPSVSQDKQQQKAIKHKLVITPLRRSSRRLAGLDPAPVTDLVIHQPSRQSLSNGRCDRIKEPIPLAEPERMYAKEKASLGEQMLFKGQTLGSSSPDPGIEFAIRKSENGSRVAADNTLDALDASSYQEQEANRKSLPETKFRSNKKRSEELQEPPTMIMKTTPVSQDENQREVMKNKPVIALPSQSSKRLGGPVTDLLLIHRPSRQPVPNGEGNGTKEAAVPLAELKRMDAEEKAFLGELVPSKGRTSESPSPLASLPSYEFWPDPCMEVAMKNGKNRLRAATDSLLDTSSYRELKVKRGNLPKTRPRSKKEKKGVEALLGPPRMAVEKLSEPATKETTEKQQRAIKEKSVITLLPTRSSKRFAGLEFVPVTDLAFNSPSRQSPNGESSGIKKSVVLADPGRMYGEEKKSLGEQILFKGQTSEDPSSLPFSELWQDPCIEFAVKTLMGEIPVPHVQQQQLGSSFEMEKLNPSASAIADTDRTRSIGSFEPLPEKEHLLGPVSGSGKACPSENDLASDANALQTHLMHKFKMLGL